MKRVGTVFQYLYLIPETAAAALLFLVSLRLTVYYDPYQDVDLPVLTSQKLPLLLVFCTLFLAALVFLLRLYRPGRDRQMLIAALAVCGGLTAAFLFIHRGLAVTDGLKLDRVINEFAAGDFSSMTEPGGYIFLCPHQLGYVAFGQLMARIFGPSNYLAWQFVNLFSILLCVASFYRITKLLYGHRAAFVCAFLSMGAWCLYLYAPYIYGDIPSQGLMTAAFYFLLRYIQVLPEAGISIRNRTPSIYAAACIVLISAACMLKTNTYIAVIAMVLCLVLTGIRDRRRYQMRRLLVTGILIAALPLLCNYAVRTAYAKAAGIPEIPKGEPNAAYLAMGLQESEGENGWYNGYNVYVYEKNGYDYEAADAEARAEVRARIGAMASAPKYGAKYLWRKFLMQWSDPVCVSQHNLELTGRHVEGHSALWEEIVFGHGRTALWWIMNVFRTLLSLGAAVSLFRLAKRGNLSPLGTFLILFIFGGMVFHEFWEGSSRYTMRYMLCFLPYAAAGLEKICGMISRKTR